MSSRFGNPSPRVLRYSIWLKVFAPVLTLGPVIVPALVLAYDDGLQPVERLGLASIVVTFAGVIGLLVVELFRVQHTFDDHGLDYRTPWTEHRTLRWAEVAQVKWSFAHWLFIQDVHGQKFRISPMLGDRRAFASTAQERIPKPLLEASPQAAAALELMRHGVSFALLDSESSPEEILAHLKRKGRL